MYGTSFAPMNQPYHPYSESAELGVNLNSRITYDSISSAPLWCSAWESVVVVDSQSFLAEIFAERIRTALTPLAVFSATSLATVHTLLSEHSRTLIVSPPRLADGPILQLASLVRNQFPQARLAIWADYTPQLITAEAYDAIIPRSSSIADFEETLKTILTSQASRTAAATTFSNHRQDHTQAAPSPVATLSERQLDLLALIAEGLSIKEIAQRWGITIKSVDSLKYRLMKELDLHNRVALTRLAILEGLLDPQQISTESVDD